MTAKKKMNKSERKIRSDVKRDIWLNAAISYMLLRTDQHLRVSSEAVGVAKTLKLAIRLKEFHDKLEAEERTSYTISEQYDYIRDILDA